MELSDLQISVNTSLQTVSSTVSRIRVSLQRQSWLILMKAATTLGLLVIMATHPALRRYTPEPWPYYKVSMSVWARNVTGCGVSYLCNPCSGWVHSKCSGLQNAVEYRRIKDWVCSSCSSPPTHSTETTTATDINSNTSCRWEYIHHHAIQRKWHWQQTHGIRWILKAT